MTPELARLVALADQHRYQEVEAWARPRAERGDADAQFLWGTWSSLVRRSISKPAANGSERLLLRSIPKRCTSWRESTNRDRTRTPRRQLPTRWARLPPTRLSPSALRSGVGELGCLEELPDLDLTLGGTAAVPHLVDVMGSHVRILNTIRVAPNDLAEFIASCRRLTRRQSARP